jgi:thiol-disulfide isomerase/thioredoxin
MKAVVSSVFLLLLSLATQAHAAESFGPKVGQTAPEFKLKQLGSEQQHSLKALRQDKNVLLLFWSTRCHVCHALIPQFKRINKEYGDRLKFVAINVGFEDEEEVDVYAFEFKLDYLILNDDDKKEQVVQDYRLRGTPTFELVGTDGVVKYRGHSIPDLDKLLARQ